MSYILYLNGNLIDLVEAKSIGLTRQVNDIARLDNRQTNFTPTFKAPKTANNVRNLDMVSMVGSQSMLPYSKLEANLFDSENGECLIYKGWAVISQSSDDSYSINIYDGNIDFYKAIENLTLTQVGIEGLNHLKNLDGVIASFDNSLPYKYIVADYNGKTLTDDFHINIDYLVPSARAKYIWDKIFDFSGFTYSGNIFNTEAFTNLWMTFPKPVPTETPTVVLITEQDSAIIVSTVEYPNGSGMGGIFYGSSYVAKIFPANFNTAEANNTNGWITIEQDGLYRLTCNGTLYTPTITNGKVLYKLYAADGTLKAEGECDGAINQTVILQANATDRITLKAQLIGFSAPELYAPLNGIIHSTFDLIIGYSANFEEALIDFLAKDFVNEIMQRHGLTMVKDKYSNNVEFLTLAEILQNTNVLDWSDKFGGKSAEKYKVGNYAKKNNFQYRYNEDNETHNDGSIFIQDVNLNDETTIISSKIYSPEKEPSKFSNLVSILGNVPVNIYRMWNKQVKDSGEVEYKDLDGRFYFMRSKDYTFASPQTIVSEALNTSEVITMAPRESYYRLKFQEIIYDYYTPIESILNKAKMLDVVFYLNSVDVSQFTFKQLVYIRQLASYYLVNKINNFVKNQPTKVELIEVDYFNELDIPDIIDGTFITITNTVSEGCKVTLTFETDQPMPAWFTISASRDTFGGIPNPLTDSYVQTLELTGKTVSFTLPAGGNWSIVLQLGSGAIVSNIVFVNNFLTCVTDPPEPNLTFITITSIQRISVVGNNRTIKVYFNTDWNFVGWLYAHRHEPQFDGIGTESFLFTGPPAENAVTFVVAHAAFENIVNWSINLSVESITSNTVLAP